MMAILLYGDIIDDDDDEDDDEIDDLNHFSLPSLPRFWTYYLVLPILHFFLGLLVLPSVTLKVNLYPSLAFSHFSLYMYDII